MSLSWDNVNSFPEVVDYWQHTSSHLQPMPSTLGSSSAQTPRSRTKSQHSFCVSPDPGTPWGRADKLTSCSRPSSAVGSSTGPESALSNLVVDNPASRIRQTFSRIVGNCLAAGRKAKARVGSEAGGRGCGRLADCVEAEEGSSSRLLRAGHHHWRQFNPDYDNCVCEHCWLLWSPVCPAETA